MTDDEQRVAEQIRAAFAGVTLGNGIGLWQTQMIDDNWVDPGQLERDEKLDWSAITVEDLDRCWGSLSFVDAEGMRFHLPAYLVAELEGRLRMPGPMSHLTSFAIIPPQTRFDILSPAQREAVCAFLRLRHSQSDWEIERSEIEEALRVYWAPIS